MVGKLAFVVVGAVAGVAAALYLSAQRELATRPADDPAPPASAPEDGAD